VPAAAAPPSLRSDLHASLLSGRSSLKAVTKVSAPAGPQLSVVEEMQLCMKRRVHSNDNELEALIRRLNQRIDDELELICNLNDVMALFEELRLIWVRLSHLNARQLEAIGWRQDRYENLNRIVPAWTRIERFLDTHFQAGNQSTLMWITLLGNLNLTVDSLIRYEGV
jgi:hypothetical protein